MRPLGLSPAWLAAAALLGAGLLALDLALSSTLATAAVHAALVLLGLAVIAWFRSGRNRQQGDFQRLFARAPDAMLLVGADRSILDANPAAERLFGYEPGELRGEPLATLVPERFRSSHAAHVAEFLATPRARPMGQELELFARRRDGSEVPVEISLNPLPGSRSSGMILATVNDVSEQREAVRRALQAERLAAIGEMVAVLAHESKNDLQAGRLYLQVLEGQLGDRPETLVILAKIRQALDNVRLLLEDVRGYAAPIRLHPEPCSVGRLVQEAWNHMEELRQGREASCIARGDGLDVTVQADRVRLRQVLRNLYENALASTPDPVQIVTHCEVRPGHPHDMLELTVTDNGPGIPAAHRDRIFEPFFTTRSRGTGLGLPIARRILEAHGGDLTLADSERGAAIRLRLPLRPR